MNDFQNCDTIIKNMDNKQFTFIDLFAGIGGIRLPYEKLGGKCVFSSEIDKRAIETYKANFNEVPSGDITKIDARDIPNFDILLGGFPCQAFSVAGKKLGFEDVRGTLFFEIVRILKEHKPKAFHLENVKGLLSHNNGNTFKAMLNILENELDYKVFYKVLNAKDFGVPQHRNRVMIVGFKNKNANFTFPEPTNENVCLGNILEKNVSSKYTISDKLWAGHQRRKQENKKKGKGFGYNLYDENSRYTVTISARYYKDGSEILIKQCGQNPRKLTPRECARLQGFPDTFVLPNISDCHLYKQFGNSVPTMMIGAVAKNIIKELKRLGEIYG